MRANTADFQIVPDDEHCVSLLSAIEDADAADPVLGRRGSPRWAFRAPALVRYEDDRRTQKIVPAHLRDLSPAGVGLLCRQAVPLHTLADLWVDAGAVRYHAKVRIVHCTRTVGSFKVGCRFVRDP